ncbi:MAG: S49 family peptidase [Gallionellales bacterium 35-53-114]|jgi:protease-4|nr:MAG: S49 family peptidase [Gallionellales bacterium 35-53-114]OYZ63064.1 MAG: S49 family peptidase [Gallionellales bacterium 24-53-125]OZB08955.1 MAG: S49 family peptidase [Gallionellales bacterium 39-52-133]HQS59371.1 S49 family peptidase [Gallionellaceae bacterium]HQS76284.1 S49 family peptidase [Gallionellaceae bacterium]
MSEQINDWERGVLEKLAYSAIQEQRRARRWSIFFKTLTFGYLFIVLFMFMGWFGSGDSALSTGKHTALIDLDGVISANSPASADNLIASLQAAFKDKGTKGVVLRINSPGGSPVQSGYVNDEITRLRTMHPDIPLYVVVDDICASGGYYIAAAADKIFVNKASIVGSIGVLMDGFGFTGTMNKLGIERRLLTAGDNKGFMDPFSPRNPKHEALTKTMLLEIHQQFISVVKQGRGTRLKNNPEIFSGLFWSGQKSIELGLADEMGSLGSVARDVIKEENIVDFTARDGLADRLAKRFGAGVASALPDFSTTLNGMVLR